MMKIGIIGCGNMGRAIAEKLKGSYAVYVFDKDKNKSASLSGVSIAQDVAGLLVNAHTLLLAVKPYDFGALLEEIRGYINGKLVITIAAGVSTLAIEKILGEARVVRVMPNMPVKIGKGFSCLAKGSFATGKDLEFTQSLFQLLGKTLIIKEEMLDAATAVSGSGPGFLCDLIHGKPIEEARFFAERDFIPQLTAAASGLGFSAEEASLMAQATARGTIEYLESANLSAQEVKEQVASPGGTTEAGLKKLCRDISNLEYAVIAAFKRAGELSKGQ